MAKLNWEPQTVEEALDSIKKEIDRMSRLRMLHMLKRKRRPITKVLKMTLFELNDCIQAILN
jgi:hypothetical protein